MPTKKPTNQLPDIDLPQKKNLLRNYKVCATGSRHISTHQGSNKTVLSTYWQNYNISEVTLEHISCTLKLAATMLRYPSTKGIPIQRVNTHSLRSGGGQMPFPLQGIWIPKYKNGMVERSKIQGIHQRRTGVFFTQNVNANENKLQIFQHCW